MKKAILISALLGALAVCSACSGGNAGKGLSPAGTWYEQSEFGGTLEVEGSRIRYTAYEERFTQDATFRRSVRDGKVFLDVSEEDYFYFTDISYDSKEDEIVCYTEPVLDGDGGYFRTVFRREPYVPPAPPVYDPPVDRSDPDAKKEFEDLTIRSLHAAFYDEGEPYDPSSNMARPFPYPDSYEYDLAVSNDGEARVSSSYCREITLSGEDMDALQALAENCGIGSINGLDIRTEGLPYNAPDYEAEIGLASGEVIRSTANGEQVPEAWKEFQYGMHRLLFDAFVRAGYKPGSNEFHSTAPMKRVLAPDYMTAPGRSGITVKDELIVPDWKRSYDYSLDTKYFVFSGDGTRWPALMKTLGELSAQYRAIAEKVLEEDYELMESASPSVIRKADRKYCYSLYAVSRFSLNGRIFSFTVSTGRANSLGIGEAGYGDYAYVRYHIDTETGRILTLADLFNDPAEAAAFLSEHMVERYGTHHDAGRRIHSAEFPAALAEAFLHPEPDGIGFDISYDGLTLWMPRAMFPNDSSQLMEIVYYDEIQDLLSDTYTQVW